MSVTVKTILRDTDVTGVCGCKDNIEGAGVTCDHTEGCRCDR